MTEASASVTDRPDAAGTERTRLGVDLDVDVCVVGAGLAGLSVALEAARMGASVAVLEGRHVGWNASGNQFGTVMPGFGLPLADLIERVGLEDARELWALSQQGAEAVRAYAAEESMPGLARSDGALEVSNVDVGDRLIARLQMLGEDFDTEVEGWQIERVRDVLRTKRYFHGVYYPRAFQVDGPAYLQGLAERRITGPYVPYMFRLPFAELDINKLVVAPAPAKPAPAPAKPAPVTTDKSDE